MNKKNNLNELENDLIKFSIESYNGSIEISKEDLPALLDINSFNLFVSELKKEKIINENQLKNFLDKKAQNRDLIINTINQLLSFVDNSIFFQNIKNKILQTLSKKEKSQFNQIINNVYNLEETIKNNLTNGSINFDKSFFHKILIRKLFDIQFDLRKYGTNQLKSPHVLNFLIQHILKNEEDNFQVIFSFTSSKEKNHLIIGNIVEKNANSDSYSLTNNGTEFLNNLKTILNNYDLNDTSVIEFLTNENNQKNILKQSKNIIVNKIKEIEKTFKEEQSKATSLSSLPDINFSL